MYGAAAAQVASRCLNGRQYFSEPCRVIAVRWTDSSVFRTHCDGLAGLGGRAWEVLHAAIRARILSRRRRHAHDGGPPGLSVTEVGAMDAAMGSCQALVPMAYDFWHRRACFGLISFDLPHPITQRGGRFGKHADRRG